MEAKFNLVYNLRKPFAYESLSCTAPLNAVLESVKSTYLSGHWPSVRALLRGDARARHVANLEQRLCAYDSSIPAKVDAWLSSRQNDGAAKAEKTFPSLLDQLAHETDALNVLVPWLYWKYSNDVLGRGKGISDTLFRKIFGDSVFLFDPKEQWLEVPMSCPYCGDNAIVRATGDRPYEDDHLKASLTCATCHHAESNEIRNIAEASSLYCDCARCIGTREQAAEQARQLAASTITSFTAEVRELVEDAVSSIMMAPPRAHLSEVGRRFVSLAESNPTATLVDLLKMLTPGRSSRFISPYELRVEAWKALPELVKDGLVDAFYDPLSFRLTVILWWRQPSVQEIASGVKKAQANNRYMH